MNQMNHLVWCTYNSVRNERERRERRERGGERQREKERDKERDGYQCLSPECPYVMEIDSVPRISRKGWTALPSITHDMKPTSLSKKKIKKAEFST